MNERNYSDDARLDRTGGFYSCFVCGHKVHESRAFGIEVTGGQLARAHGDCISGFTPQQLELLYFATVHDMFSARGIDDLWRRLKALGIKRVASGERYVA